MSEQQPNNYKPKTEPVPYSEPVNRKEEFRGPEIDTSIRLAQGEHHLPMTDLERNILIEDHPDAKADLKQVNEGKMTWDALRTKWGW